MNDNHKPKLALGYGRRSLVRSEAHLHSPKRQRSTIEEWAERRGCELIFFEDAKGYQSGRHGRRKGFRALVTRLYAAIRPEPGQPPERKPDYIVIETVARLGRNVRLLVDVVDDALRAGVEVVFVRENIHLHGPDDPQLLEFHIRATLAHEESDETSRRMKWHTERVRAKGGYWGRLILGVKRLPGGPLAPDDAGAWWNRNTGEFSIERPDGDTWEWRGYHGSLARLYELFATGEYSRDKLGRQLDAEGWPFRNVRGEPVTWQWWQIEQTLRNWRLYAGSLTAGKNTPDGPERVLMECAWEPILPLDLIERVAAEMKRRRRHVRVGRPSTSELGGLLLCAHCRRPLYGYRHRGKWYYRHRERCEGRKRQILGEKVERGAREAFAHLLHDLIDPASLEARIREDEARQAAAPTVKIELDQLLQERERLLEQQRPLIQRGIANLDTLERWFGDIDGRIAKLQAQLYATDSDEMRLLARLRHVRNLPDFLGRLTPGERRELYQVAWERIEVDCPAETWQFIEREWVGRQRAHESLHTVTE